MTYRPTFEDARARLRRAGKQFEEFKAELLPTKANVRNRIELSSDFDPQSGEHVFMIMALPSEDWLQDIAAIVGDVMTSVRSALDYMMWQLALVKSNGGEPPGARGIYFPCVHSTPAEFRNKTAVKRLGKNEQTFVERFQPYNSWEGSRFHPLSDVFKFGEQKHRTLYPIRTGMSNFGVEPIPHGECVGFRPSPGGLILEVQAEFCRATIQPLDESFDPKRQVSGWSIPHIGIDQQGRDATVVMDEAIRFAHAVISDATEEFS